MPCRRLVLMCALAAMPLTTLAQGAGEARARVLPLEWVAGDLPPFAFQAPDQPQGYAHDLAVLMGERIGRSVQVGYYPWARAVRLAEQGDHFGIFPLARTPDREQRFQWLVPLMTVRYVLVTRATDRRLSLSQLRKLRVGVLRGSPIVNNLRAEHFTTIIDTKDYKDMLRLLVSGTVDAVYAGGTMLEAAMGQFGYARQQFTVHESLGEAVLYMAASPGLAAEEAQRWQKAYQSLQEDGSVERLKRLYFPADTR